MRFSWQGYWSGLPSPPPVDHILPELFAMTHLSWVALCGTAHSITELCKPLHLNKAVIQEGTRASRTEAVCLYFFHILCGKPNYLSCKLL